MLSKLSKVHMKLCSLSAGHALRPDTLVSTVAYRPTHVFLIFD